MKLSLYFLLLIFISCASSTPQTNKLVKDFYSKNLSTIVKIPNVPFVLQKKDYCGPSTLVMAMKWAGKNISIDQVSKNSFIPNARGTFQMDMISAARREGMLAVTINNFESLFRELEAGHPVIVFENLGLSWYPQWHYAIVHGYDIKQKKVLMHSGVKRNKWWDIKKFERSWKLANYWGLVILPASRLPATASEIEIMRAAASLEKIEQKKAAMQAYYSILRRWPKSYMASMGIANIYYKLGMYIQAKNFYKQAIMFNPDLEMGRHNLAITEAKLLK